jgi:hypothetical protein
MQRAQRIRGTAGLGLDPGHFLRAEENVAGAVDEHADAELVDHGHVDRTGLGQLDAGKSAGRNGQARGHFQGVASIDIRHGVLSGFGRHSGGCAIFALTEIQG